MVWSPRVGGPPQWYGQTWLASLTSCPLQDLPGLLAPLTGEELHVARLLASRRDPGLIDAAWLWDIPVAPGDPQALPTVAYHLAALQVVTREDLLSSTATYLARHRSVLLCREPDDLLVPLVLRSPEHPQTLLAPFDGMYGDPTITAAAAWHLEHRQPREAWALARSAPSRAGRGGEYSGAGHAPPTSGPLCACISHSTLPPSTIRSYTRSMPWAKAGRRPCQRGDPCGGTVCMSACAARGSVR